MSKLRKAIQYRLYQLQYEFDTIEVVTAQDLGRKLKMKGRIEALHEVLDSLQLLEGEKVSEIH